VSDPHTVPGVFFEVARQEGSRVALRHKALGIWQEITWSAYAEAVRALAYGLASLGLGRGERVAIASENRPEWLYMDLAAQSLGAIPFGVYADSSAHEVTHAVASTGARVVLVEDQEQADKVIDAGSLLPELQWVIVVDPDGLEAYRDPRLVRLEALFERGRRGAAKDPEWLDRTIRALRPEDPAILSFTSGTTSEPKAVVLSHEGLLQQCDAVLQVEPFGRDDEAVSYLPLPWLVERLLALVFPLRTRYRVNFPENMEMANVLEALREIQPSILMCAPRVWENFCSMVYIKIENATRFKRFMFRRLMPIGERAAELTIAQRTMSLPLRAANRIADRLLFWKIRERLGCRFVTWAYTGGAAIGPEVFQFFHAIGINLRQMYGQTELGGLAFLQRAHEPSFENVGPALPGMQVRIADDDEIVVRGPSTFLQYWGDSSSIEAVRDGHWVRTGDKGFLTPDGRLVVIDRRRDLVRLSSGQEISPALLENRLKFSPYVKEAIVIGDGRPYVAALIQMDPDNVGDWAQRRNLPYTTFKDLARKPDVRALIATAIDRTNGRLPESDRIKAFHLLEKELDADDGEITRTRKVRRGVIAERYAPEIDALYTHATGLVGASVRSS
jgi:long-chain acyl-CoA synthetase